MFLESHNSISLKVAVTCLSLVCVYVASVAEAKSFPDISLTLIPPTPVTDKIDLDIRAALWNRDENQQKYDIAFYLDSEQPQNLLSTKRIDIEPGTATLVKFSWPTKQHVGSHKIMVVATSKKQRLTAERPMEIVSSDVRSTRKINGAWADIVAVMPDDVGLPYAEDMRKLTDTQWCELVRAMNEVNMNIIVITQVMHNHRVHIDQHDIDKQGYKGLANYPSRLFPMRKDLASKDPIETILSEADRLGMHVFPGVGLYAWFDYTEGSLRWHKEVADELWRMYGHHPSFYGWYVTEEAYPSLGKNEVQRQQLVHFFKEFKQYVNRLAPDKPVMMAPSSWGIAGAGDTYPKLLKHLDILSPCGFQRQPPAGDYPGEEAARVLQKYCDQAGAHLWIDIEVFVFSKGLALYPRPIEGVLSDLHRFTNFEKVLCYQFPGQMNAPWMSKKPGGREPGSADTVRLYTDYKRYLQSGLDTDFRVKHAARGRPVNYKVRYSEKYAAGGSSALTDGKIADAYCLDGAWQGFLGSDLDAIIDLGDETVLKNVEASFLQEIGSGIFLPKEVEIAVSGNGQDFQVVATLKHTVSERQAVSVIEKLGAYELNAQGRYVRLRARNYGTIPDWHAAADQKAWLFVDEIIINSNTSK